MAKRVFFNKNKRVVQIEHQHLGEHIPKSALSAGDDNKSHYVRGKQSLHKIQLKFLYITSGNKNCRTCFTVNIIREKTGAIQGKSFEVTVLKHLWGLWGMMANTSQCPPGSEDLVRYNNPGSCCTSFCPVWVNTNSISVTGNSLVASWQDFWAERKSIVWALYVRESVCLSVAKMHMLAQQQADGVVLVKLVSTAFPTFSVHIFSRTHSLIAVLCVREIHSWPDTYNNASSLLCHGRTHEWMDEWMRSQPALTNGP